LQNNLASVVITLLPNVRWSRCYSKLKFIVITVAFLLLTLLLTSYFLLLTSYVLLLKTISVRCLLLWLKKERGSTGMQYAVWIAFVRQQSVGMMKLRLQLWEVCTYMPGRTCTDVRNQEECVIFYSIKVLKRLTECC
jgi:hypothetical protein